MWTNTCCSHPLFGQVANEVDEPLKPDRAEPMGVKHAAVRKIRHELGTKAGALDAEQQFKYMGRVHYWAADTVTWGPNAPWGEHEIDYLLLCQLPKGVVLELDPHPEEVMAVDWVTADELKSKMADTNLLWSPWFRVIARELLFPWWADLSKAITSRPYNEIRRFDPPQGAPQGGWMPRRRVGDELADLAAKEKALGPPNGTASERRNLCAPPRARGAPARPDRRDALVGAGGAANKQGAYGKVPTHAHTASSTS